MTPKGPFLRLIKQYRLKIWLLILEICQDPGMYWLYRIWTFLMQYLENLCVPTNFIAISRMHLFVSSGFYFILLIVGFARLIRAILKVASPVQFMQTNHYFTITTIFS